MLNKTSNFLFYNLIGLFVSLPVMAHEYWLQPDDFILEPGEKITAHIKVGQQFKGNNHAYLPDQVASIQIHGGNKTLTLKPRLGDYPAISQEPLAKGLNIVSLESNAFMLSYQDSEKFEDFVRAEGLDWVLREHNRRGLPFEDFIEAYRRHTKTLVQVSDGSDSGSGQDRKLGLEFEWVLQSNPYTDNNDDLVAQLWWRGKVFPRSQVKVFVKQNDQLSEQTLTTNDQGLVSFKRLPDASYLINAVHMIVPEQQTVKATDAVWESRWTSLTFATPKNNSE